MSGERPDFLKVYNAIKVPAPLISMDAGDRLVSTKVEAFFKAVQDSLDLSPRSLEGFFEYDDKMLVPRVVSKHEYQESNDYVHQFKRKGSQVIAAVTYTRDDFNAQITQFSKYSLLTPTVVTIRELQHLERIEAGLE